MFAVVPLVVAASTFATASASEVKTTRGLTDVTTGTVPLVSAVATACGVDLLEKDLTNGKSSDPMACWMKCRLSIRDCNAVTWTNHEGGTCWYKQWDSSWAWGTPKNTAKTGAISYFEYRDGEPEVLRLSQQYQTDMPGYDIGNTPERNEWVCESHCAKRSGCFAVTWSPHQGGTCWFKSMASNAIAKEGLSTYSVLRRGKLKCQ